MDYDIFLLKKKQGPLVGEEFYHYWDNDFPEYPNEPIEEYLKRFPNYEWVEQPENAVRIIQEDIRQMIIEISADESYLGELFIKLVQKNGKEIPQYYNSVDVRQIAAQYNDPRKYQIVLMLDNWATFGYKIHNIVTEWSKKNNPHFDSNNWDSWTDLSNDQSTWPYIIRCHFNRFMYKNDPNYGWLRLLDYNNQLYLKEIGNYRYNLIKNNYENNYTLTQWLLTNSNTDFYKDENGDYKYAIGVLNESKFGEDNIPLNPTDLTGYGWSSAAVTVNDQNLFYQSKYNYYPFANDTANTIDSFRLKNWFDIDKFKSDNGTFKYAVIRPAGYDIHADTGVSSAGLINRVQAVVNENSPTNTDGDKYNTQWFTGNELIYIPLKKDENIIVNLGSDNPSAILTNESMFALNNSHVVEGKGDDKGKWIAGCNLWANGVLMGVVVNDIPPHIFAASVANESYQLTAGGVDYVQSVGNKASLQDYTLNYKNIGDDTIHTVNIKKQLAVTGLVLPVTNDGSNVTTNLVIPMIISHESFLPISYLRSDTNLNEDTFHSYFFYKFNKMLTELKGFIKNTIDYEPFIYSPPFFNWTYLTDGQNKLTITADMIDWQAFVTEAYWNIDLNIAMLDKTYMKLDLNVLMNKNYPFTRSFAELTVIDSRMAPFFTSAMANWMSTNEATMQTSFKGLTIQQQSEWAQMPYSFGAGEMSAITSGAAAGAKGGPWGAVIGAAAGAIGGVVGGLLNMGQMGVRQEYERESLKNQWAGTMSNLYRSPATINAVSGFLSGALNFYQFSKALQLEDNYQLFRTYEITNFSKDEIFNDIGWSGYYLKTLFPYHICDNRVNFNFIMADFSNIWYKVYNEIKSKLSKETFFFSQKGFITWFLQKLQAGIRLYNVLPNTPHILENNIEQYIIDSNIFDFSVPDKIYFFTKIDGSFFEYNSQLYIKDPGVSNDELEWEVLVDSTFSASVTLNNLEQWILDIKAISENIAKDHPLSITMKTKSGLKIKTHIINLVWTQSQEVKLTDLEGDYNRETNLTYKYSTTNGDIVVDSETISARTWRFGDSAPINTAFATGHHAGALNEYGFWWSSANTTIVIPNSPDLPNRVAYYNNNNNLPRFTSVTFNVNFISPKTDIVNGSTYRVIFNDIQIGQTKTQPHYIVDIFDNKGWPVPNDFNSVINILYNPNDVNETGIVALGDLDKNHRIAGYLMVPDISMDNTPKTTSNGHATHINYSDNQLPTSDFLTETWYNIRPTQLKATLSCISDPTPQLPYRVRFELSFSRLAFFGSGVANIGFDAAQRVDGFMTFNDRNPEFSMFMYYRVSDVLLIQ